MFGYILPDKPNMFMRDYALYKSFYCGMCKSIKCHQNTILRLSVNYDVTFINILLHGIMNEPLNFVTEGCILNPIKKKCILKDDPISEKCVYLNTLLIDFKLRDDLTDKPSVSKRILRGLLKGKIKKSKSLLPKVAELLDKAYIEQVNIETKNQVSFDKVAHPFAICLEQIFEELLGDKYTEEIGTVAYFLAKYVYLLDAIDDFEKDVKNKEFNVFANNYPEAKTLADLLKYEDSIMEILSGILVTIKENYEKIPVFNTEGIITNTFWYGLGARAKQIIYKENSKCQKNHTKF